MQTLPALTRLPSGDLAANIDGALITVKPNHSDRRRLRYWRAVALDGRALSPWVSTQKIALAIAAAALRRG